MNWTRRHGFVSGIALIAATNAVVLLGAAWNRGGEPESTLRLSQRELQPSRSPGATDDSGLALRLRWRVLHEDITNPEAYRWPGAGFHDSPSWLDRDKMAALGFDVTLPDNPDTGARTFGRQLARDVLLVLEADGPEYRRSLQLATAAAERLKARPEVGNDKKAGEILERESGSNSRLFVIDAGLDAATLRSKYADRSRYAIVRGRVEPAATRHPSRTHSGSVSALSIDEVHVPLGLRPAFAGAVPDSDHLPRATPRAAYDVTLVFGRRLEPWVAAATKK